MNYFTPTLFVPNYSGEQWIGARLPASSEPWPSRKRIGISIPGNDDFEALWGEVRDNAGRRANQKF